MSIQLSACRNMLLRLLPDDIREAILKDSQVVSLGRHQVLIMEGEQIDRVYFPVDALVGIVAPNPEGLLTEAAIFGWDGCSDMVLLPGYDRASFRTVVQIPGRAICMSAGAYASHLKAWPVFMALMLRYQQAMASQLVYTSAAVATQPFLSRLARWLLMYQDRVGPQVQIAHDIAAMLLSVNRTYVTQALGQLRDDGCIALSRGQITILNRPRLLALTNGYYGPAEAEYARVLGPLRLEPGEPEAARRVAP